MTAMAGKQLSNSRHATRENNLIWLESFGCEITKGASAIRVQHNELAEYNAWLVYGDDEVLIDRLRIHTDQTTPWTDGRVFIDKSTPAPAVGRFLRDGNFDVVGFSTTYVALAKPGKGTGTYEVKPALPEERGRWATMYSEGFSREHEVPQDMRRWRDNFASSSPVRFWFVQHLGQDIGVFQTCHAYNVVGLYSLTLTRQYRSFGNLRGVVKCLVSHLAATGHTHVYFERESCGRVPPDQIRRGGTCFEAVRVMSINRWRSNTH